MFSPLALTTWFRGARARGKTKGKDRELGFTLSHCSNKYKLAREGEKVKEKDEDIEASTQEVYELLNVISDLYVRVCVN